MNNEMVLICGPVIGRVTSTSARILVEIKDKSIVTLQLTPLNSQKSKNIKKSKLLESKTPTIYEFTDLTPECLYKITFVENIKLGEGVPELKRCQFRTLPAGSTKSLKIATLSCSSLFSELRTDPKYSLWRDLAGRIEEFDYVFHNGDQVYLDDMAWHEETRNGNVYMTLKNKYEKAKFTPEVAEEMRNVMREQYRKVFNYEFIAHVHRNAPNFMILDDHEFSDDFGFRDTFLDYTTFDGFYSIQGRYVYYQYQRQLREDIDFKDFSKLSGEQFVDIIAGLGVIAIDYRGCKTWNKKPDDKLKLGSEQWGVIENCFGPKGLFDKDNVKGALLFSATVPVYLPNNVMTRFAGAYYENDVYEQWAIDCPEEQTRLLKLLIDFKARTGKEVAIITGDIHMRGITDIKLNGENMLRQFVSSGVASEGATPFQEFFLTNFIALDEGLTEGFGFKHIDYSTNFNYGEIDIIKNSEGKYDMFATHTESCESKQLLPGKVKKYDLKAKYGKEEEYRKSVNESQSRCSIF
jgi:hypothetical protein